MMMIVVVMAGRDTTATDTAPEHLLPQADALLPSCLLGIFVIGAPMAILDDAKEANKVASRADTGQAVFTQGVPLSRGGLAGAESVSP